MDRRDFLRYAKLSGITGILALASAKSAFAETVLSAGYVKSDEIFSKSVSIGQDSEVANLIISGIVLTGRSDNNFIVNSTYNTIDDNVTRCVIAGGGAIDFKNKIGSPTKPHGADFAPIGWADDTDYPYGAAGVATIGGGYDNIVNQIAGTICGGGHNFIKYHAVGHSFIGGGGYNVIAGGACAIVMGGRNSISSGERSLIGGGRDHNLAGSYCTILGGDSNSLSAEVSSILGGKLNAITAGAYSNIVGGFQNSLSGTSSSILGGNQNQVVSGSYVNIIGGVSNIADGDQTLILSGINNHITATYSSIVTGSGNTITTGPHANIVSGASNSIAGRYSSILGGKTNTIPAGGYSNISGGINNSVSGSYSSVSGGSGCIAAGDYNVISGGAANTITVGSHSVIVGGTTNTIAGTGSSILGGSNNSVSAQYAAIAGGYGNSVTGAYSFASGRRAKATAPGVFCISDNQDADFSCATEGQYAARFAGGYKLTGGSVGVGASPVTSASLAVVSTTTGFLPPTMTTTQRDAITTPAEGLQIYNLTTHKINFYNGSAWEEVTSGVV